MTRRYDRSLTVLELEREDEASIDYSDIPELDDAFFREATVASPDGTRSVRVTVKASVLEAFQARGEGYRDEMSAALESYAQTRLGSRGTA